MLAAFIVSLIISTVLAVDSAVGQAMANDRNNKITKEASAIYNQISKDRDLMNRLADAYNRRDTALANQMLMSSPFGTRISTLKRAYKDNQNKIKETNEELGRVEKEYQRVSNEINTKQAASQTSGSAIVDLITGASKDPTNDPVNYKKTGVTEQTIQEVNYGQK